MFLPFDSKNCIFVGKKVIHQQQCAQMCGGVACKPGRQDSAISKASLHADHPSMCLKMLCKCTINQSCNASLCEKARPYFHHCFLLCTFNSKLSLLSYYVNLPKGEVLANLCVSTLTNWGRVTHICVGNLTIIGSDNGLSPGRHQAIIWTDAGILLIGPSGTDFSEILIKIHTHSFKKIRLEDGGHFVLASMC